MHGGAGAAGAACRTGESARLDHGDEGMELRGSYAAQDVFRRAAGRARTHQQQRVTQHLQRPLDASRGGLPGAGEREPGITAVHETGAERVLDMAHRLGDRRLAQVGRARRRADAAAPDDLVEEHQVPQVRYRLRARGLTTCHVHNFLYPAANCNYPTPRAPPDNGVRPAAAGGCCP